MSNVKLQRAHIFSFVLVVLFTAVLLVVGSTRFQKKDAYLQEYASIDVKEAERAYLHSNDVTDLLVLLRTLAYQQEYLEDTSQQPLLRQYGQVLFDLAKTDSVDLEHLSDEQSMLHLIGLIRQAGAR